MDNGSAPATKKDLAELEQRIEQRIESLEQRIRGSLREDIHSMETKLLTAFFDFARANQMHMSQLDTTDAHMTKRLMLLEERVLHLETGRTPPPPGS